MTASEDPGVGSGTPAGDGGASPGRELADQLRSIAEALAVAEVAPQALSESARLARQIRDNLAGARRPRWYDGDANQSYHSDPSRRAYLDLSPVRGELNPIAPPLRVQYTQRDDGTPVVRGYARLGLAYEGPPHGVHGGWVAALFDDLLGAAQGLTETRGVTAKLEIKYRQITPIDADLRFEAWIHEQRGRRLVIRGVCRAGEILTAEAKGLFVRVDFNRVGGG